MKRRRLTASEAMQKHVRDLGDGEQGNLSIAVDPVGVIEAGRSAAAVAKHELRQAGDPLRLRSDVFPPGWKPRKGTVVASLVRKGLLEPEYALALEYAVTHAERAYGGHSRGLAMQYDEMGAIDDGRRGGPRMPARGQGGNSLAEATFRTMMMEAMNVKHQRVLAGLIRDYYTQAAKGRLDVAELGRKYLPYKQRAQQVAAGTALVKSALEHALEFYGIPRPRS